MRPNSTRGPRQRQPGQDVTLIRPGPDDRRPFRVPSNGTVVALRTGRARPLVCDASVLREDDLVIATNLSRAQAGELILAWLPK